MAVAYGEIQEVSNEDVALTPNVDLFDHLGSDDDDGGEFIERFSNKYEIDISGYRWYFHHGEASCRSYSNQAMALAVPET